MTDIQKTPFVRELASSGELNLGLSLLILISTPNENSIQFSSYESLKEKNRCSRVFSVLIALHEYRY